MGFYMNYDEALAYLNKLGITNAEIKELYLMGRKTWPSLTRRATQCYESKEYFIKELASNLKYYGNDAVRNKFQLKGKYTWSRAIKLAKNEEERDKIYHELTIENIVKEKQEVETLEDNFQRKFYLSFVHNIGYSFSIKFKKEEYEVIVPKTTAELMKEGFRMNNCLKARAYWMALETMKFFFIRKKNDINTPLIDVVLTQDNRILWAITKDHENVCGDNKTIVNRWYKACFGHTPTKRDYVPKHEWFEI